MHPTGRPANRSRILTVPSGKVQTLSKPSEKATHPIPPGPPRSPGIENFLDLVTDGIITVDRGWIFTYVNGPGAATLNRKPGDLLGKHLWTEFPDAVGGPFHRVLEKAMADLVPVVHKDYFTAWDRWFEVRGFPSPEGMAILFSEISQWKQMEYQARESEERLRLAVKSGNVGLWDWDLRTNKVWFSPEWKRQIGYEDHEIPDEFKEWEDRCHPDDRERMRSLIREFLKNPWPNYRAEFRFRHRDGRYRWIHTEADLERDVEGTPVRMVGSHIDITGHKHNEELLKGINRILESIVSGTPLEAVLTALVLLVEGQSPEMTCSILLLDEDGVTLRHGAAPRLPEAYSSAIDGQRIGPKAGSCGTAAYRRAPVYVGDIDTDPLWNDWKELILAHGYHACWSTPIFGDNAKVIGTFAIYYREQGMPSHSHLDLIRHVTSAAAIAITRHHQEEEIRLKQRELEAAQEQAKLGSWTLDVGEQHNHWSAEMYRLFGRKPVWGAPSFQEFLELVHPDDRTKVVASYEQPPEPGRIISIEFRGNPAIRLDKWFRGTFRFSNIRDGQAREMVGTTMDITESKLAVERVRMNEERLRLVIDATSDGIWDWDIEADSVSWTDRVFDMLGLPKRPGRLSFLDMTMLAHPDDAEKFTRGIRDHLEHGTPCRLELRIRRGDASYGHFLLHGSSIPDAEGKPARMVGSIRDLTDIVNAGAELRRARERSQSLSRHLIGILEEERSRIAREIHDELGQLLAAVKMDLTLAAQILAKSHDTVVREYASREIPPISRIVDDGVVTLRRIIRNLRPEVLDTLGLVAGIEWQLQEFERRYRLRCTFKSPKRTLRLDPGRATILFRFVQEALTNIAKHAGASRVDINLIDRQGAVTLTVTDDGRGISETDLAKPDSFGLMGLEERLRSLGGTMDISGPGVRGAKISVRLPKMPDPLPDRAAVSSTTPGRTST